jgi:hypothetical protein
MASRNAAPLPALGAAGGHPDFERRLTMIMSDRIPCRVPMLGMAFIGLLALVALPGWSNSQQAAPEKEKTKEKIEIKTADVPLKTIVLDAKDGEVVQGAKPGSDAERLDRLEKQLEALLQEVKAMRAGAPKAATKEIKVETKPMLDPKTGQLLEGKKWHYEVIQRGEGGEHTVTLTRATYKMPKEKADALAKFLGDQVKGPVLETKVDGDSITVTTTPGVQRIVHELINLVQGKTGQTGLWEYNILSSPPELKK